MVNQLTAANSQQPFSIGGVLGTSLSVFFRNIIPFGILSLVLGIPYLLIQVGVIPIGQVGPDGSVDYLGLAISGIISTLTSCLITAALVYGTFQDLRGQRAGMGACIAGALSTLIPVAVGAILYAIAIGLASLAFIIPGLILATVWWVYVPAIVIERQGIMSAFGRSAQLTKGRRWSIFGLILLVVALGFAVGAVVGLAVGVAAFAGGGSVGPLAYAIAILQLLIMAFGAVLSAVGYYYLRAEKEGIDINDIAQVFD